jgi:hypothetical protein
MSAAVQTELLGIRRLYHATSSDSLAIPILTPYFAGQAVSLSLILANGEAPRHASL